MSFIGVMTNAKNETYIVKMLSSNFSNENIIFITDKNINNLKNITFETIIIDKNISNITNMKLIISKAKYVILNADLDINVKVLEDLNLKVISYGFNRKATVTVSSVSEGNIMICMQRSIENIFGEKYELQEYEVEREPKVDIYAVIYTQIILLIYQNIGVLLA